MTSEERVPAAMRRQPMDKWMDQLLKEQRREYRASWLMRRRDREYAQLSTARGDGVQCDSGLRRGLRLVHWRTPRTQRHWLLHDEAYNRLIALEVAGRNDELEPILRLLLDGLNWAAGARG